MTLNEEWLPPNAYSVKACPSMTLDNCLGLGLSFGKLGAKPSVRIPCECQNVKPEGVSALTAVKTTNWFVRKSTGVTTDIPYP